MLFAATELGFGDHYILTSKPEHKVKYHTSSLICGTKKFISEELKEEFRLPENAKTGGERKERETLSSMN